MNLNKIFLIGNLTQDPEMRSTQTGQTVTTLNMATNRAWTDKNGEKQTAAEFHRVVAWGRLGEIVNQYLKKGGLVMIEGRIQTRSWTDQNNIKRYTTEIVAEGLQLGPRMGNANATVSDIQPNRVSPTPVKDDDIPIIDANDPVSSGVDSERNREGSQRASVSYGIEEDEVKIKEEDLPF
ncbi:MAG: single-stranded DNA-binding protein [Candidatus Yanofskybacteria bacterium]|nr:single-stranded DNA-binding protein [Candidatus Yanofskybacteria bacterium]